ncbi:hypothetical protein [Vibrio sp. YIC-376]
MNSQEIIGDRRYPQNSRLSCMKDAALAESLKMIRMCQSNYH